MFKNNTGKVIYLECGACLDGADCEVTDKEAKMLERQGLTAIAEPTPEPVPVEEQDTVKKPQSRPPAATPAENTTLTTPLVTPEATNDLGTDEFGPMKGTDEWSDLTPTEKMLITRKRNLKYGPQ